jgi:parallel beta-helix repeat protein
MRNIYTTLVIVLMSFLMANAQNEALTRSAVTNKVANSNGENSTKPEKNSDLLSIEKPEAWFPFDGDFLDYSGNSYHGTNISTSWTTDRHGNPNGALSFNGNNSGVRLDNGYPNVFQGSMTFSCWVYFNDNSRAILFGNFDGNNSVNFEKHNSSDLRIYWNQGERNLFTNYGVVSTGSWHFIAFTRNFDANSFRIYLNGQILEVFYDVGSNVIPEGPFYIGRDTRTGTTVLNGKMDDVRIYGTALTDAEVLALYNETASLPELITSPVTGIIPYSATAGGEITMAAGSPVTGRGVVWSTTENPTIENNLGITSNGVGNGEFSGNITGLNPNTTYFVRAYATNAAGTAYGQQTSFTTTSSQSVSGVWTLDNSPYFVDGEIIIPEGETLIIEPGVTVKFKTNSVDITELSPPTPDNTDFGYMMVHGTLIAVGEPDSIVFTRQGDSGYWGMVHFTETANVDVAIEWLKMEYASYFFLPESNYDLAAGLSFNGVPANISDSHFGNSYYGVLIQNSTGGIVNLSFITQCIESGITAINANAVIIESKITNNEKYGILAYTSNLSFHSNEIKNNSEDGIFSQAGTITIEWVTISENGRGVYLDQSSASISHSNINNNFDTGLTSLNGDTLVMLNNAISGNVREGISCTNTPATIKDNNLSENHEGEFEGQIKCEWNSVNIMNNTITGGAYPAKGIVLQGSQAAIAGNNFLDCIEGIVALSDCDLNITGNVINNLSLEGLGIYIGQSVATIQNNQINYGSEGIRVYGSADCEISNNTLNYCYDYGLQLLNSGNLVVSENTITNSDIGIYFNQVEATATGNEITNNFMFGIYSNTSAVSISDNNISNNGNHGIFISESQASVAGNTIHENYFGVEFNNSFSSVCDGNTITNHFYGIACYDSYSISIKNNEISGNTSGSATGIRCLNSTATIDNNSVSNNWRGIDFINSQGEITNSFWNNNAQGAVMCENDTTIVSGNTLTNNGVFGIYFYNSYSSSINNISIDNTSGIKCIESNSIIIQGDSIVGSTQNGIWCSNSNVQIDSCTIINNYVGSSDHGQIQFDGGTADINYNTISSDQSTPKGIFLKYSNGNITNNTITKGSNGIALMYTGSVNVSHNKVHNTNWTGVQIYAPTALNQNNGTGSNTLIENIAAKFGMLDNQNNAITEHKEHGFEGGQRFLKTVTGNIITGANTTGLAVSDYETAVGSNNLFLNNTRGVFSYSSTSITLQNSIIWGNETAVTGNPTITYSCVQGGYSGTGNINQDPLLDADYNLTWANWPEDDETKSPCINTGNPDTDGDGVDWWTDPDDQDPDRSRIDMGVRSNYYHIEPAIYFYNANGQGCETNVPSDNCENHVFPDTYVFDTSSVNSITIKNRVERFFELDLALTGDDADQFFVYGSPQQITLEPNQVIPANSRPRTKFAPTKTGSHDCTFEARTNGNLLESINLEGSGLGAGNITGTVTSTSNSGVSGVTITVINQTTGYEFTDSTKFNGTYAVTDVGYGHNYTITPSKIGPDGYEHEFSPTSYTNQYIASPQTTLTDINFVDLSVFPVTGRVVYENTDCGVEDVSVMVSGVASNYTDSEGFYELPLPYGEHIITVSKPGHTFKQDQDTIFVTGPMANVNFEDTFTYHLFGFIGGDCEIPLTLETGQNIQLKIQHVSGCMNEMIVEPQTEGDSAGFFAINLPPANYQLSIDNFFAQDFPGQPLSYGTVEIGLMNLANDTLRHDITFLTDPQIEVTWSETESDTTVYFFNEIPVLHQLNKYTAIVEVYRPYVADKCPVPLGDTIQVYDGISDDEGWKDLIIADTTRFEFFAGIPNIIAGGPNPYQKKLQFQYVYNPEAEAVAESNLWTYVLGIKPRVQAFTTTTPQIPLWILRDPPGDNSYSFWEQEKTISQAVQFSMERGEGTTTMATVNLGLDFEITTGFIVNKTTTVDMTLDFGAGFSSSQTQNSLTENQWSFTTNTAYQTSSSISGEDADLFVGAAVNIIYGITDILSIAGNEIVVSQDIILVPKGFETTYVYTQDQLLNFVIPSLELIGDQTSVDMWNNILEMNNTLKEEATFKKNYSFNGGGSSIQESETIEILQMTEISFQTTIDKDVALAAGLTVDGIGALLETNVNTTLSTGSSRVNSTTTSTTTGYHLEDDDAGDNFTVDIKYDPYYGTPVFDLISGQSSCPFEMGTQPRQGCSFDQSSYLKQEIVGNSAFFEGVILQATGQTTNETFNYKLSVLSETNPFGAEIYVDGVNISGNEINVSMKNFNSISKNINLIRDNAIDIYEITGVAVKLVSACDPSIADTAILNAYFVAPCTYVNITEPGENWVVNGSNTTLSATIGGYDLSNPSFQRIDFQYRHYGTLGWGNWTTKETFQKAELGESFTIYDWDMQANQDGLYQIRAVAICTNNQQTISPYITGYLDKSEPELVSSWPVIVLEPGDEIYFTYDEALDPSTVNLTNCKLHNIDNLQTDLPLNIKLLQGDTRIKFEIPSNIIYFAENQTLVAKVSGVKDIYGNQIAEPDSIIFYVDLGPLHWSSPTNITIYDDDGMDISFSKVLDNSSPSFVYYQLWHAAWLTTDPQQGEMEPLESLEINFAADALEPGAIYYDTIKASTIGHRDETIRLRIIVGDVSPQFVTHPESKKAAAGETVVFEAQALGFPEPNYYWKKNETVIPEAINNVLIIENVTAADVGDYQCFAWNTYGEASSEIATLSLSNTLIHSIELPEGWSGLSSYLMPDNTDIESLYGGLFDELVIAATQDGIFYPAYNINTIDNWEQHAAYKVKTNTAVTLNIVGTREENKTLQLDAGWNLIPVVSSCPVDAEALFASVAADLNIVKEVAGYGVYWPEMGINSLGTLNPGSAYYVSMANAGTVTFDDCEKSTTLVPKMEFPSNPIWQPVQKTPGNHVIGILEKALVDFETGDYIGVFTAEGICAGQILINERKNQCALIAFGMDNFGKRLQGFEAGERFSFKLYKTASGEAFEIIPEFDLSMPGADGLFEENGISVITGFKKSGAAEAIEAGFGELLIFPNPTDGSFTITGVTPDTQIEIYDMQGRVIKTEAGNSEQGIQFNLAWSQPGIYIIRIKNGEVAIYRKLILR